MVLGTRILLVSLASIAITTLTGLTIQRAVIRRQGIEMIRDTMRATLLSAENNRQSVSGMRNLKVFDEAVLKADAAGSSDYRQSKLYQTVPVVAAWNSIAEVARHEGYEFRIPARHPRNPKNTPNEQEDRILSRMDGEKLGEFFEVDESTNEAIYGRPIILSGDCMVCHGDPATSVTADGKDILGLPMEGWREGDRHGVFLLRSKLTRVDDHVKAGMVQAAVWLIPLAGAIGIGVYFLIGRLSKRLMTLVDAISSSSDQVTGAVNQISSSNQSMAFATSRQAASLEETTASTSQIAGTTRANAEHSREAAVEMGQVDRQVRESTTAIEAMSRSMAEIQASSRNIGRIIRVIDELAFQTNILSLNAAVEAARAGEAGAGFAVVADEVRNLAHRSAQAARETAPLIEESINISNAGSVELERTSMAIHAIATSSSRARKLVDEVNLGSEDQAQGMGLVSLALVQMQDTIQNSAASSEETAAASQEMASQAAVMNNIARQLRVVVQG